MELEALFNAIIVKPIESQESTYGSIIVPDLGSEKNQTGEVVSVGPGQSTIMGTFVPTISKVGDVVVLPTQGFTKLPHNGNEYYVGPENQILAKINTPLGEVLAQTQVTKEEINHLTDLSNE
jgi:chaperonin GroES|tara:strand:- start:1195 stop:1560 length:366 start_codon:yes stop_codon:yes gene_type:complete